jgi:hypothetical protein
VVGPGVELAAKILKRLRAGDRLDEVARDYNATVGSVRKFFLAVGIDRKELEKLRSKRKTPELRLPEDLVPYASRRRRAKARPTATFRSKWSDDDLIRSLVDASTMAYPLSATAYDKLRDDCLVVGPSAQLIALRFSSWSRACEVAGVECGSSPRDVYTRSWSNRDLVAYVRDYIATTYKASFSGYQQWASQNDGAPSAQTIRNRLGPWAEVKQMALQPAARASGDTR